MTFPSLDYFALKELLRQNSQKDQVCHIISYMEENETVVSAVNVIYSSIG